MANYSTKRVSEKLIKEIISALKSIDAYGSIELYVQDNQVTQITTRTIKKTNGFNRKSQNPKITSINQRSI